MEESRKIDHPIKAYWKLYGGWQELIRSPYTYAAVLVAWLAYPLWAPSETAPWADICISIMPNLMGFSIAALTVLLAFSDSNGLRAITQHGKADSYFVKTAANLFHFLVVQTLALLLAITAKSQLFWPLSYCGTIIMIYAIFGTVAAAGQLLNTAIIVNKAVWMTTSNKFNSRRIPSQKKYLKKRQNT